MERERGCDRRVAVYGFLRGCAMKPGARVHLAGVGDFTVSFPPGSPLPPSHTHLITHVPASASEAVSGTVANQIAALLPGHEHVAPNTYLRK